MKKKKRDRRGGGGKNEKEQEIEKNQTPPLARIIKRHTNKRNERRGARIH